MAPISGIPEADTSLWHGLLADGLQIAEKRRKKGEPGIARPAPFRLEASHVRRLQALGTGGHFELDRLALIERLVAIRLDGRKMDENVLATLSLYESKAFTCVEPLYCSLFFHVFPFRF
jgi:hypothetical protein